MSQNNYILFGGDDGECRGVYSSLEELKKSVSIWMKSCPNDKMSYSEWIVDTAEGAGSWDWAYIPKDSNPYNLASGGAMIPKREFWGHNLIGLKWTHIPHWEAAD